MTQRLTIFGLTIFYCLTFSIFTYGQSKNSKQFGKTHPNRVNNLKIDTSKTAIIPFNKKKNRFHPFDTTYKAATLTQNEIESIDSLLMIAVADYNNSLDKEHQGRLIEFSKYNYRKQLVVATNQQGEKQVYVNCFCHIIDNYWKNRWKVELFLVEDGGQCFFDFKINLKSLKTFDFNVNGYG